MTMRTIITTTLICFALTLGACDKGDAAKSDKSAQAKGAEQKPETAKQDDGGQADAPTLDPKVEKAVTVANKIAANPSDADDILTDAGLDRDSFDKLLYEIARDPEMSKSYAIARDT